MKNLNELLNESIVAEAKQHRVQLKLQTYTRGYNDKYLFVEFQAEDHLDMIMKIVENCGLYLMTNHFTDEDEELYVKPDATPDEREKIYNDALDSILNSNGDGCDWIAYLSFDREVIVDEENLDFGVEFEIPAKPKKVGW